jgi:cell pole-organizing protein PopZ
MTGGLREARTPGAMSTSNSVPQSQHPSLESEQRAHEPSMEEILASIRRIIADDDALPLMRRPGPSLVPREPSPAAPSPSPSMVPERRADLPRHPAAPAPAAPPVHLVAVPPSDAAAEFENEVEGDAPAAANMQEAVVAALGVNNDSEEDYARRDGGADEYELRPSMREAPSSEEEEATSAASEPDRSDPVYAPAAREREDRVNTPLVSPSTDASVASSFQSLATSMFLRDSDLIARTAREMLRPMLKQWLDDNLPVMVERLVRAEIERVARGGR